MGFVKRLFMESDHDYFFENEKICKLQYKCNKIEGLIYQNSNTKTL